MPLQNIRRFQESITKELDLIKNRVRDLIGDANWGDEGRYKEAILRRTISQFLPSNLSIGTGFILSNDDHKFGESGLISSQLDIIVYENNTPVIFRDGDFVILTEDSVRGVIEVKTKITNYSTKGQNSLNTIIDKINRLREFRTFNPTGNHRKKFIGIFVFEYDTDFMQPTISTALQKSNGLVNHISLGPNKFIRYWESSQGLDLNLEEETRCYIRYNLTHLSFSYFISNLLHIVADNEPRERYWFSFPIHGTKEQYRELPIITLN